MDPTTVSRITLTTAFFNFSRFGERIGGLDHYLDPELLATPVNLVFYGDPAYLELVKKTREQHGLSSQTRLVPMETTDLDVWRYFDRVEANRSKHWPSRDDRAPTQVHLVNNAKFELVKRTMQENPFGSDRFGWIDANALKKTKSSCQQLLRSLSRITDKVHIMVIVANDRELPLEEYYAQYRYVMSGMLFTLGQEHGEVLDALIKRFQLITEAGYGHAEEMVWLEIMDRYWDVIARSYGDYQNSIVNFVQVIDNLDFIHDHTLLGYYYLGSGYHRELLDVAEALLASPTICKWPSVHAYAWYYRHLEAYYLGDSNKVKESISGLGELCAIDPDAAKVVDADIEMFVTDTNYSRSLFPDPVVVRTGHPLSWRSLCCFAVQDQP